MNCRSGRAAASRSAATSRWTATTSSSSTSPAPPAIPTRSKSPWTTNGCSWRRVGGAGRRADGAPAAGAGRGAADPAGVPHPGEGRSDGSSGVTFIEHNQARDENTLRPRMRGRGTQPAIASVTISGPYNIKGPGDTPSRRRIFVCGPRRPDADARVPDEDSHDARAAGVPASGHRRGHPAPAAVLRRRPGRRRIRSRHSTRDRTDAGEPAVPVPHRTGAGERGARHALSRQRSRARLAPVVFSLEQHSRRRAAGRGGGRTVEEPARCSSGRSRACSPIRVRNRW